jgi:hypothetical protein
MSTYNPTAGNAAVITYRKTLEDPVYRGSDSRQRCRREADNRFTLNDRGSRAASVSPLIDLTSDVERSIMGDRFRGIEFAFGKVS